jgi:hypothetical protein
MQFGATSTSDFCFHFSRLGETSDAGIINNLTQHLQAYMSNFKVAPSTRQSSTWWITCYNRYIVHALDARHWSPVLGYYVSIQLHVTKLTHTTLFRDRIYVILFSHITSISILNTRFLSAGGSCAEGICINNLSKPVSISKKLAPSSPWHCMSRYRSIQIPNATLYWLTVYIVGCCVVIKIQYTTCCSIVTHVHAHILNKLVLALSCLTIIDKQLILTTSSARYKQI